MHLLLHGCSVPLHTPTLLWAAGLLVLDHAGRAAAAERGERETDDTPAGETTSSAGTHQPVQRAWDETGRMGALLRVNHVE